MRIRMRLVLAMACAFLSADAVITACASSPPPPDTTAIIVFSRHTFRGIAKKIGSQQISLPDFGIDLAAPTLSYAEDATPHGLAIAEQYASTGIQKAAEAAVLALGESRTFDGHWDEIRADFSTERTFWTALRLRQGLMEQSSNGDIEIPFTGCKAEPGKGVDVVAIAHVVDQCVPEDVLRALQAASPDLEKLRTIGQDFLNGVKTAIGAGGPPAALPDPVYTNGELPPEYDEMANLASIIEMSAELGPPLQLLFKGPPPESLLKSGKAAVTGGLNTLGIRFFTSAPLPLADAVAVYPVNFINAQSKGHHTIVLSHDDFISALLHALGLISSDGDPDDLAIYPIESFVFALSDSSVSIVRMRIETHDPDGHILGPYSSKVLWKGTRVEWDAKVQASAQRAQAWDLGKTGNDCLKGIQICTPETVKVFF